MSEQVYLKCVSVVGDREYLTVDKVYQSVKDPIGCELYYFTDDNGEEVAVHLPCSSHGTFEIVEAPQETPKLTPRSLGCFQQVANVIGELRAEVELQQVIDYPYANPQCDTAELTLAFSWRDTPQGHCFWDDIDDGDVPEGYTPPVPVDAKEQPKQSLESQPKFGDVLHLDGVPYVFLKNTWRCSETFKVSNENGGVCIWHKTVFDEYRPDPTQELREQILKDWQKQSLDHAYDTEVCRVESSIGDIINFILDNGYRKESQ